jgi:glycine/D-amino acid oxidase-like deaminating enzyme
MEVNYIIVGQGLAGTLLANELIRQGKSLVVFNDPDQIKSSDIAAGLINPVVFRRMTKSWMVDNAFHQMEETYRQLEGLLHQKLYYPIPICRILGQDDVALWKTKALANRLGDYLDMEPQINHQYDGIATPFGIGKITKAGRVDIQQLISSFTEFLRKKDSFRNEKIDFEKLQIKSDMVCYKDVTAEKIIFCEGAAASFNPYFKKLKFKHSKGEILELEIPGLNLNEIVSKEVFVMPVGDDRYRIGATYRWDELNMEITTSAREELRSKLNDIIHEVPEIINQKAGIRPTMHDRKPVIGFLEEIPQIGIFNGLGSKGVLLGPYQAFQFTDYILGNSTYIHPEANINRYFKKN